MSKKKNRKFRHKKKHSFNPTASSTQRKDVSQPEQEKEVANEESIDDEKETETSSGKEENDDPYTHNQYDHVKKDTKKILFILVILITIFAGFYILNSYTSVLSSFGNWIYKIANIQIQ